MIKVVDPGADVTYPDLRLGAGEIRALGWVSARHPLEQIELTHVRDRSGCGWIVVKVSTRRAKAPDRFSYWLSPTGRVFRGDINWTNHYFDYRTEEVLREADYVKVS